MLLAFEVLLSGVWQGLVSMAEAFVVDVAFEVVQVVAHWDPIGAILEVEA